MPFLTSPAPRGLQADGRVTLAKGQSRSNREAKKPKATKVKAAPAPSPAGGPSAQGTARDRFEGPAVNDDPVNLDEHRGMAAQRDTEIRRDIREVQVDQAALRDRQEELEDRLLAAPAATRAEAAANARYLIQLFAAT